MREFFHTMKVSFLLAAILYVILGLVLLLWPGVSAVVFCYAFGGVLLAYGVVTVVSFFRGSSRQGSFVFELRWASSPPPGLLSSCGPPSWLPSCP